MASTPPERSAAARTAHGLDVLFEEQRDDALRIPDELVRRYGGALALRSPVLYANFVQSLDGVVALEPGQQNAGSAISGRNDSDRFVMGLLRAAADAVLIGAGTLRATPQHRWTAEHVYPALAAEFALMRRGLRMGAQPRIIVVTARGDIPPAHPGLSDGALVLTTVAGAERLRAAMPAGITVRPISDGARVPAERVVATLREEGHQRVLTEGGPTLFGELLRERLVDELFVTVSPAIFGRASGAPRMGLVEGAAFSAGDAARGELRTARRDGDFLFLRYAFSA